MLSKKFKLELCATFNCDDYRIPLVLYSYKALNMERELEKVVKEKNETLNVSQPKSLNDLLKGKE